MSKEINRVKNWNTFLNESLFKNDTKEIENIIHENNFSIRNLYDVENVKGLIGSFKLNSVVTNTLFENYSFFLDEPGGVIIFSTELNSTLGSAVRLRDKVRFFFESKFKSFLNSLNTTKRLKEILLKKFQLVGYTVGKSYVGAYTGANDLTFNEKSYTIDVSGVDSKTLLLIATEICREFKQETVLVKDFNKEAPRRIYFVDDKEVPQNIAIKKEKLDKED